MTQSRSEYMDAKKIRPEMECQSGRLFHPDAPVFHIDDIAHGLGNTCRFGGQCRVFYSVAEHSLLVAWIAEKLGLCDPFEALMHDAQEGMGCQDLVSGFKLLVPDYKRFEGLMETALRRQYKLPAKKSDGCKLADGAACLIEAWVLMPSKGKEWASPPEVRVLANRIRADITINAYPSGIARDYFKATFHEMAGPRGFAH